MIRAVAFDWGGVFTRGTFDSGAVEALSARYAVPAERVAEAYYPLMEAFEEGAHSLPTFKLRFEQQLASRVGASAFQVLDEETFRSVFLGSVRWREPMVSVLNAIPSNLTVGMLSNNIPELCDRVRNDARMARIERFVFSNEIRRRKPDAAAFKALSDALGVPPTDTVFIDDNVTNIRASEASGFNGILIEDPATFVARWRAALNDVALPEALDTPERLVRDGLW